MISLLLFILTIILDYLLLAIFVGISFHAVFGHRFDFQAIRSMFILFGIFALLDIYFWPALMTAQITFTVHNPYIAEFFDTKVEMDAGDLFEPGWFDILGYLIQASIGDYVGRKVFQKNKTIKQQVSN